jgi:hypothetical protein
LIEWSDSASRGAGGRARFFSQIFISGGVRSLDRGSVHRGEDGLGQAARSLGQSVGCPGVGSAWSSPIGFACPSMRWELGPCTCGDQRAGAPPFQLSEMACPSTLPIGMQLCRQPKSVGRVQRVTAISRRGRCVCRNLVARRQAGLSCWSRASNQAARSGWRRLSARFVFSALSGRLLIVSRIAQDG